MRHISLISAALAVSLAISSGLMLTGCQVTENLKFTQQQKQLKLNPQTKVALSKLYQEKLQNDTELQAALKQFKKSPKQGITQLTDLAEQGNNQAQYELYRYYKKQGNKEQQQKWLDSAAENMNYLALKAKLQAAQKDNNPEEAAKYNLNLAIMDDLPAMYATGYNYIYGNGLPVRMEDGLSWLEKLCSVDFTRYEASESDKKAATQAVLDGAILLCHVYSGEQFSDEYQNNMKNKHFSLIAAELGSMEHQILEAMRHSKSEILKEKDQAVYWYKKALEPKNKHTEHYGLAASLYAHFLADSLEIPNASQDLVKYANIAIKHERTEAYFPLGYHYFLQKNFTKAESCFTKVLPLDEDGNYHLSLGAMYLGLHDPKAIPVLYKAGQLGKARAFTLLSQAALDQRMGPINPDAALKYQQEACRLDYKECSAKE